MNTASVSTFLDCLTEDPQRNKIDPRRDRLRVRPGRTAERRRLADERLVELAFAGALKNAGHLGQQIGAAARERGKLGHRGGLLVAGELAPLRPEPRLAGELGYQDPVSLRTRIDHAFEYRTKSRHGIRSSAAQVGDTDVTESSDGGEQSLPVFRRF
jgi:hypothetical protein